jgi:exodeoxyribonuclease VII small subunit
MTKKTIDYAKTLAELEAVLAKLQDSETSLDEAITLHTKGKELVAALDEYLKDADIIVKKQVAGK